jgi:hypothetical protein
MARDFLKFPTNLQNPVPDPDPGDGSDSLWITLSYFPKKSTTSICKTWVPDFLLCTYPVLIDIAKSNRTSRVNLVIYTRRWLLPVGEFELLGNRSAQWKLRRFWGRNQVQQYGRRRPVQPQKVKVWAALQALRQELAQMEGRAPQ